MASSKKDLIIIGFDTEYTLGPDGESNIVLSYQYAGKTDKGEWSGIIYPEGNNQTDRIKLVDLIGSAIEDGRRQKILPNKWPDAVYATAHFSRADLPSFKDFDKLKKEFDSIRKTFVTLGAKVYKATYRDKSRNQHKLKITLLDTMLLTPGASSSLDSLGDLYDFPKIELPEGSIEKMDQLLIDDQALFESYAIRDAEICAKHAWNMAEFAEANFGLARIPITLGSLATKHVEAIWNEEGIKRDEVLGKEEIKDTRWNAKARRIITKKKHVLIDSANIYEQLATECYHGGRNEAYVFGFTDFGDWTDYDLAGAYTTAMAAIRVPDFDALNHSKKVSDYKADRLGLARISAIGSSIRPIPTEHML